MTTNAFIFSWDQLGIEAIVPITAYEHWDGENLLRLIAGKDKVRNPLYSIVQGLILRARFNPQRHYEIYAIDCDESLDEIFWREQWNENPQETADLIRKRGQKIYSERANKRNIKIV
jgi:hypothetical protein